MDSESWRQTYEVLNERPCPFEQAILSGSALCNQSQRLCIAERQGVQCGSDQAQIRCLDLARTLRQQARFALRLRAPREILHHNQALRLQIGGLRGLQAALYPERTEPSIQDISALISAALDRFGSFADLPYPLILRAIGRCQPNRRR